MPADHNQYEIVDWTIRERDVPETIVFFEVFGEWAQGQFLAIHRITNKWSFPVIVRGEHNHILLSPSNAVDVSSAQVTLEVPGTFVHWDASNRPTGTYQLLCCSTITGQAGQRPPQTAGTKEPDPAIKNPVKQSAGDVPPGGGPPPGPQPNPDPPQGGLPGLQKLIEEAKKILEKLDIAQQNGQSDRMVQRLKGELDAINKLIGKAAIAEARREMEELRKKAHELIPN